MKYLMLGVILSLLTACDGSASPDVATADGALIGEWNEVDVSAREPLLSNGALHPVVGHLLGFTVDRMTETWSLDDGSALSGSIGYEASDGEILFHPDPSPLAGGDIPAVPYVVNGGRLQLGAEMYSRAGR